MTKSCRNFPLPKGTVLWARVGSQTRIGEHQLIVEGLLFGFRLLIAAQFRNNNAGGREGGAGMHGGRWASVPQYGFPGRERHKDEVDQRDELRKAVPDCSAACQFHSIHRESPGREVCGDRHVVGECNEERQIPPLETGSPARLRRR